METLTYHSHLILYCQTAVLISLSFFAPSLGWIGLNAAFFTPGQIKRSLGACAVTGILFGLFISGVLFCLLTAGLPYGEWTVLVIGTLSSILLCICNENILKELGKSKWLLSLSLLLITGLSLLCAFFSLYINIGLLLIYLIFGIKDLCRNIASPKTLLYSEPLPGYKTAASGENRYRFKHKPNIYFFYLESFHSSKALQKIYRSDDGKKLDDYLQRANFTIYQDAFSNYTWTLDTRESVFNMTYSSSSTPSTSKEKFRPQAIDILKQNGYKVNVYDPSPFVFGHYSNFLDFAYYKDKLPPYILRRIQLFCPLFAMSSLFRTFINGIDPGKPPTGKGLNECQAAAFQQIAAASSSVPSFNIFYFGPGHTEYYKKSSITPENWPSRYLDSYLEGADRLRAYIDHIIKHDPQAIIVTMGDHGAHAFDYIWAFKPDFKERIKKAKISIEDLYEDLCSILLAIRVPDYISLNDFWPAPTNIFPYLIWQLSGYKSIWENRPKEISLLWEQYTFHVIGIHGKACSRLSLLADFDFSSIGHATDKPLGSNSTSG